ncbi:MAG: hypothetical protein JNM78_15960 [Cyclobacteriaceae bacterium]|nr:hypothetical protein [Cyclobacteriaceae bacterium]
MRIASIIRPFRFALLCTFLIGCTYYEIEPIKIPEPKVPKATTNLEASYVTIIPNKINSAYWKSADFLPITSQNQVTNQIPSTDGLFNMSGTLRGLLDFNNGVSPDVTLKAAYTNDSLYVLVSWKDDDYNASRFNWFYDGPTDPNKAGSTAGWTSQQSDDNLILSFNMGSSKQDVWNWSLALSEPMGYAIDMINNGAGAVVDTGNKSYIRNAISDNRSGPAYEWNGVQQELQRTPAGFTILDPGYYLLNKKTFSGDLINGENIYQAECALCHGKTGDGEGFSNPVGIRLNKPGQFNRLTRQALDLFASDGSHHEGAVHYPADDIDRTDLFARLRGFSGIPGYYLENPTGSNSDIRSVSNVQLAKIDGNNTKGYSVLLIRALNTTQADDVVFTPISQSQYEFSISIADNDNLNKIGVTNKQLTFKPKK